MGVILPVGRPDIRKCPLAQSHPDAEIEQIQSGFDV
jgi:hypothetical protein